MKWCKEKSALLMPITQGMELMHDVFILSIINVLLPGQAWWLKLPGWIVVQSHQKVVKPNSSVHLHAISAVG